MEFDKTNRPIFIYQEGREGFICFITEQLHLSFVLNENDVEEVEDRPTKCCRGSKVHKIGKLIFGDDDLVKKVLAKRRELYGSL